MADMIYFQWIHFIFGYKIVMFNRHGTMLALNYLFGKKVVTTFVLSLRNRSIKKVKKKLAAGEVLGGPDDYAYNYIERKRGLLKPLHTIEEQKEYMKSEVFAETYKGRPINVLWRRNMIGQWKVQPPPRLFCIDRNGRFNVGYACPLCRDEYLFFDYRNPELLEHFLYPGTDQPLPIFRTGLCQEQYVTLQAQLLKAKEHGTFTFNVPFRHFDYGQWYPKIVDGKRNALLMTDSEDDRPSRDLGIIEDIYPNPTIEFEIHNRDIKSHWDEWWVRQERFVKKLK